MAVYVQYHEDGTIAATVRSFGEAPKHPRQLKFDKDENGEDIHHVETAGMRVNLQTKKLEKIPQEAAP